MFRRLFKSATSRRRISWLIAAVLILPLVIFFNATGQESRRGPGGIAGIIFGKQIPWSTFEEERLSIRRQMEAQLGQMPDMLIPMINRTTWDRLILVEEAKRERVRTDDLELAVRIQQLAPFQEGGRFVPQRYYQFLRMSGLSPQQFEDRMRHDLLIEKLLESVKQSVTVTDEDLRAAYRKSRERLKATAAVLETSAFRDQAASGATEDALRAHYVEHPELVRVPEQLKIEYAGKTREELAPSISVTDEEVRTYYDERPEDFADEQGAPKPFDDVNDEVRRRALDDKIRKALKTVALDVQDDLDERKPFDEIVSGRGLTKKSAGPLSLGNLLSPGAPEPAVLQALGRISGDEITPVVETPSGVYIARTVERIPSRVPPFEEVQAKIREDWVTAQAKQAARAAAEAVSKRVTGPPGMRLEEAAAAEGRNVRTVEFDRAGMIEGLGSAPVAAEAAFAAPLGQVTAVVEGPQGFALLRPDELVPLDESAFASQQETLRQQSLTQKQDERVDAWLNELRDRAQLKSFVDEPSPQLPLTPAQPVAPPAR